MVSVGQRLQKLRQEGRFRTLRETPVGDDSTVLNLSSNDYLGLTADQEIREEFYHYYNSHDKQALSLGVSSSRLLTGSNRFTSRLEDDLAGSYGREASLVFNSGYHANIGILSAICEKDDLIVSDKLNHISIQDGLKLSKASVKRFNHCDYEQLEFIVSREGGKHENIFVVTESVFSMDGDCADLKKLAELKQKYGFKLYVDEAHAVGLYGQIGLGKAEEYKVINDIDFLVGTFGKAFGSVGAFVICSREIREYLINHSRSFIYTTALPPVVINWNHFILKKLASFQSRRDRLAELSSRLRAGLVECGLQTDGNTNIVPVIIGDIHRTVQAAERLQECGLLVLPVRPPTVPEGQSRFRLSLTADMHWQQLAALPRIIAGFVNQ